MSRWAALARQEGSQALRRRKPPGGPRKLKGDQLAQLPELLQQGPGTFGFSGEIWTRARIAQVIRQEFGVSALHNNCTGGEYYVYLGLMMSS